MELKDIFSKKYIILLIFSILFVLLIMFMYINKLTVANILNMINLALLNYVGILFVVILLATIYNMQIIKTLRNEQLLIKEIVKNPSFMQKITSELNEVEKEFIEKSKIENIEFKRILKFAIKKSKNVFSEILDKNFNFNSAMEIYEIVKSELIKIEDELNKRKIEFNSEVFKKEINVMSSKNGHYSFEKFVNEYKNRILKPEIEYFSKELYKISKEQKNGVRRKNYHNLCIKLIDSILIKSETFYIDFQ